MSKECEWHQKTLFRRDEKIKLKVLRASEYRIFRKVLNTNIIKSVKLKGDSFKNFAFDFKFFTNSFEKKQCKICLANFSIPSVKKRNIKVGKKFYGKFDFKDNHPNPTSINNNSITTPTSHCIDRWHQVTQQSPSTFFPHCLLLANQSTHRTLIRSMSIMRHQTKHISTRRARKHPCLPRRRPTHPHLATHP